MPTCRQEKERKAEGDVKSGFCELRKSGKSILLWGVPTVLGRPVETLVFAALCEAAGGREVPWLKRHMCPGTSFPCCSQHSGGSNTSRQDSGVKQDECHKSK